MSTSIPVSPTQTQLLYKKKMKEAAARRLKGGRNTPGFGTEPGARISPMKPGAPGGKRVKGKYIGKEKYGGLTKNAPKGKYKGKYIGPDRFKGDAAAWQKYKDEKAGKRKQHLIPRGEFPKNRVGILPGEGIGNRKAILKKLKGYKPATAQPVGPGTTAPK